MNKTFSWPQEVITMIIIVITAWAIGHWTFFAPSATDAIVQQTAECCKHLTEIVDDLKKDVNRLEKGHKEHGKTLNFSVVMLSARITDVERNLTFILRQLESLKRGMP